MTSPTNSIQGLNFNLWSSVKETPSRAFASQESESDGETENSVNEEPILPSLLRRRQDDPLRSSDYFFSMVDCLANPVREEHRNSLRLKVSMGKQRTEDDKEIAKNEIYKNYKDQKTELKNQIAELHSSGKVNYLNTKSEQLIRKTRSNSHLLEKLKKNDPEGFLEMLVKYPERAKTFVENRQKDNPQRIQELLVNNSKKLFKLLSCLQNTDNQDARETLKQILLKLTLASVKNNTPTPPEEYKALLEATQKWTDENTKEITSLLNELLKKRPEKFSTLIQEAPEDEVKEVTNQVSSEIQLKIDREKRDFIDYFPESKHPEVLAAIHRDLNGNFEDFYNVEFFIKSHAEFDKAEIGRLNVIAANRNMTASSDDEEGFSLDFDVSDVPESGGLTLCLANEELLREVERSAEEIAKRWDKTLTKILTVFPTHENIFPAPAGFHSMLGSRDKDLKRELVAILIIDAAWRILCASNYSVSPNLRNFLRENEEWVTEETRPSRIAETTAGEFGIVKAILKEQKQHVFERFRRLNHNYEGFVRRAKMIGEQVETIQKGTRDLVFTAIKDILDSSYHEKSKTVYDTHHHPHIMGYEAKKSDPEDVRYACKHVNWAFMLPDKVKMTHFERAHTFPFPAMMNWKMSNVVGHLKNEGYHSARLPNSADGAPNLHALKERQSSVSKTGFNQFKEDPMNGDAIFAKELLKMQKNSGDDAALFIYNALNLLCKVHLYLLSETESVPSFINQEMDQLSEWHIEGNSYKKSLAESVIKMLQLPNLNNTTLGTNFQEYLEQTQIKTESKIQEWTEKTREEKDAALLYTAYRIGALQTKQAILAATEQSIKQKLT
jgi:hypothetical protein